MDWWDANQFQRTALVSTRFFHGMLPYIWEDVKIRDLFKRGLIPAELSEKRDRTQVRTPEPISPESMTRFHFYAPYIKVLRVPIHRAVEVYNWKPLTTYSKKNELLPNLIKLECEEFDLQTISIFLSSSTQTLTIDGPTGKYSDDSDDSGGPQVSHQGLDMASTRQLLEHTAQKCPNLHSLEFHPESSEIVDTPTSLQTFTFLSSFKHLRHLVSTPVVIQSAALQLVAQLPNLSTLSIKPNECSGHWDPSLCELVPASGFPALSDLTLLLEEPQDTKQFWELIPFRALKNLDLAITSRSRYDEPEFIPVLCQTSPLISRLRLAFGRWALTITADMFEHLARLPIESCSLVRAKLDFEGAWAKIAGSWPSLKSIECSQSADLDDIFFLSSNLPNLENLDCSFDLERAARRVESNWMPVGRPPFYPNLRHLNPLPSNLGRFMHGRELRGLARFFAYFWPRLSIKYIEEDEWEEYADHDNKDLRRMNQAILAGQEVMFTMFEEMILAYVHLFHPDLACASHGV
ncbi:hypothetical protein FRC06_011368 [Ceratobasidium sp. 370]|nr:hypothetical protein FRC06_011368 [Ceratobasidium sp. 370]